MSRHRGKHAPPGTHDITAYVQFMQEVIDKLTGTQVLLVGTTNYSESMAAAILRRTTRVLFNLPNQTVRQAILDHLFRQKSISGKHIERLANLTVGWSPAHLTHFVKSIEEDSIDEARLSTAFIEASKIFKKDFENGFNGVDVTPPKFLIGRNQNPLEKVDGINNNVNSTFDQITKLLMHPDCYVSMRAHLLLFGPPGGVKLTLRSYLLKMLDSYSFMFIQTFLPMS